MAAASQDGFIFFLVGVGEKKVRHSIPVGQFESLNPTPLFLSNADIAISPTSAVNRPELDAESWQMFADWANHRDYTVPEPGKKHVPRNPGIRLTNVVDFRGSSYSRSHVSNSSVHGPNLFAPFPSRGYWKDGWALVHALLLPHRDSREYEDCLPGMPGSTSTGCDMQPARLQAARSPTLLLGLHFGQVQEPPAPRHKSNGVCRQGVGVRCASTDTTG
jgi:hypothetical protein